MEERNTKIWMSRKIHLILLMVLIDSLTISVAAEWTAVVKTAYGPVQGRIQRTFLKKVKYAAFKGIKYAKPPVGYLRFKPPVPIDPWIETLNATVEGNICPQIDSKTKTVIGAEDCLFINVYTPVTNLDYTPRNLKPVMIWIYGGTFITGSGSTKINRPDYLLEKGVVFVSFNYRLGALGFLNLYHRNASGNAGLKDQNLAFKWVQDNIKNFGGNPNNVTIIGESTGAVSVGFHVLSDASAGLFHGAISMSGVPLNPRGFQTPRKALSQAKSLGELIGSPSTRKITLLNTFYKASAEEIVKATTAFGDANPPFTPTLEDESISTDVILSECTLNKYKSGNFNLVPQILGYMDNETLFFAHSAQTFLQIVTKALDVASEIGMGSPTALVEAKNQMQSTTKVPEDFSKSELDAVITETSDLLFIAQIDQTQKLLAEKNKNNPVYYYHNSFNTNRNRHNIKFNTTLLGAAHADDLAYIFYMPELNYSTNPRDPTARTIDRVTTMWTNFAKYGNPTPGWINDNSLGIKWLNSGSSGYCLNIGTNLAVESRPVNENTEHIELMSWPKLPKMNACI